MAFYDDLVADLAKHSEMKPMLALFQRATVLHCQNVMDYYAHDLDDAETFIKQIGRIVPPFDMMWMEFAAPATIIIAGKELDWLHGACTRAGILIRSHRIADGWRINYAMFCDMPNVKTPGPDFWQWPYMRGEHAINADGYSRGDGSHLLSMPGVIDDANQSLMLWQHSILNDVMLLALSFMNCKNVALDAVKPAPPARSTEDKRLNRWPRAEHDFHTIRIMPLRSVTHAESAPARQGDVSASSKRLHIVRGHFATYTEDKPLLGKTGLFGQFWIPQHARGNKAKGDISADYDIILDDE